MTEQPTAPTMPELVDQGRRWLASHPGRDYLDAAHIVACRHWEVATGEAWVAFVHECKRAMPPAEMVNLDEAE